MSKSKSGKRRKSVTKKNLFIVFLVFVILAAGYVYIKKLENEEKKFTPVNTVQTDYEILENNDSINYIAVVIYNQNININTVANDFYGDNNFWPYIFQANEQNSAVKRNPLDIPKGTILKLPRIQGIKDSDGNLRPEAIEKAKQLADTILSRLPSFN